MLFLAAVLVAAASADPAVAGNDLVSSSARFGRSSASHLRTRPRRRRRSLEQLPPLDAVPAPAFPTTEDAEPHHRRHLKRLPVSSAVGRAVGVVALVILCQTLGDHPALPEMLRTVLATWQRTRTEWPLALATACAFCLYGASDALSQVVLAWKRRAVAIAAAEAAAAEDGGEVEHGVIAAGDVTMMAHDGTMALDLERLVRTGCVAAFLSGFVAVFYFSWLERLLSPAGWRWAQVGGGNVSALAKWASIAGKIGVDVGLYEPIYDVLYITLQALLRGEGLAAAGDEVRRKVLKVWRMAPRYWCAADAINFGLVPLRLRPTANALFSIPWGMFISSVANA